MTMELPLQGVRILELSQAIAGPFAMRTLADLGAQVIKVSTLFRVLKFKPAEQLQATTSEAAPSKPTRLRPPLGHDNTWWWEGIERGELLIQKCSSCGELRHPPGPMCGKCQSIEWGSVPSKGRGSVYTFTVMHYPEVPGYEYPFVAAVIDLDEGTRLVSNVVGCEPGEVHIGMPVELSIELVDDELKLPLFRPEK